MSVSKKPTTRKRTTAKKPTTRRRRPAKKKGFLSEFVTAAEAKGGMRAVLNGALGAVPAIAIEKIAVNQNPTTQGLIMLATGFGVSTLAKAPQAGAGCAAIGVYKILQETGMLNDAYTSFADPIENLPEMLHENDMYALQEGDARFDLQDGYGVGYFNNGQGYGGY